jgi:hypothetical protein
MVYDQFLKGNFAVRRMPGIFNGIWTDLALEQTQYRDAKTKGLKGITTKPKVQEKYIKAVPSLTAVADSVSL